MQSLQMLISAFLLVVVLTACTPSEPKDPIIADAMGRTLGDWMHDIDAVRRAIEYYKNLPPNQRTPQVQEAFGLAGKASNLLDFGSAGKCWPKTKNNEERLTTANTDHACLDALGFKRSK